MSKFDADPVDLWEVFTHKANIAGFRVPEYQRTYDWDEKNILRYFEDLAVGLYELQNDPEGRTFLGTLILVESQKNKDEKFDGVTFDIVDGQQRLTTTSLLASVLHKTLSEIFQPTALEDPVILEWLSEEVNYTKQRLQNCIFGFVSPDGVENFPFPRIVRDNDSRAPSLKDAKYNSLIANYLFSYATHITNRKAGLFDFTCDKFVDGTSKRFLSNLKLLQDFVTQLINAQPDESSLDFDSIGLKEIISQDYRFCFSKLPSDPDDADHLIKRAVDIKDINLKPLLVLLCFCSYFLDRVLFTRVIAPKVRYAFDIFDALNTTGEPLTAIETFKPRVVEFENNFGSKYSGSPSEISINHIENFIDTFEKNSERQSEAQNLIVSFALYQTGKKLGYNLNSQRGYLRKTFNAIEEIASKRKYIKNLGNISDFRERFWSGKDLSTQLIDLPENDREICRLLMAFIVSLKTKLAIPILARYYYHSQDTKDWSYFVDALKALAAFIVLWRSVTGTTGRIDSALRGVMYYGNKPSDKVSHGNDEEDLFNGLNIGINSDRKILEPIELKLALKSWLAGKPVEINNKDEWVAKAMTVPIYSHSATLCRFLLLAATHKTAQVPPGSISLKKDKLSLSNDFLKYSYWRSDSIASVEHVAPQQQPHLSGWHTSIYDDSYLVHSIGNLTLLPSGENSAVGNKPWKDKLAFYQIFSATTDQEFKDAVKKAKTDGVTLGEAEDRFRDMLNLPFLTPLAAYENWDAETIRIRTKALLELAWEEIHAWLF
ncbi:DUF262 domain-containing protein [Parahaliea sp. F7430]|uniref:DUF262 domain-containing protein n=1 Tax=Sediminihaliea albiluteola TaxID=2758564 RepID=A0A7W2YK26_9GAMM|nr:DUF262 domain-containing HNH endonuclease family protein [Sediminihaliea albiluteola]MBA6414186.1 DUF262 domain-containing protein [Sediminihaliea albiluteola]